MKKMKLDTFMDFRMLSSLTLSPDGSRLAYVVTGIDREKKEYVSRLRLRTGDEDRAMVSDGKIGEFFFEDAEHILFATDRRDEKKKEKDEEEKGASTVLYRLPLTGGEAEKAYELPLDADSFRLLPDGNLLMTGEITTENPDLYLLEGEKKKKALEKIGEEKDYEVLTESPFVYNGRGLIQGKRSALFLYQPKENRLRRLTGKYTDVGSFRVHGKDVYFSGVNFRNRCPNRDGLYHLDLETGKTEKLPVPRLIIYAIEFIGDTLVVIGADGKRFGDNENPCFYTFDPRTGEFRLLCEADESMGYGKEFSSVSSAHDNPAPASANPAQALQRPSAHGVVPALHPAPRSCQNDEQNNNPRSVWKEAGGFPEHGFRIAARNPYKPFPSRRNPDPPWKPGI